jgi:hypothetical protein
MQPSPWPAARAARCTGLRPDPGYRRLPGATTHAREALGRSDGSFMNRRMFLLLPALLAKHVPNLLLVELGVPAPAGESRAKTPSTPRRTPWSSLRSLRLCEKIFPTLESTGLTTLTRRVSPETTSSIPNLGSVPHFLQLAPGTGVANHRAGFSPVEVEKEAPHEALRSRADPGADPHAPRPEQHAGGLLLVSTAAGYRSSFWTTLPWMSVRRNQRPWNL